MIAHLSPVEIGVVGNIDHTFNPIASHNQRAVYNLLFKTASDTLKFFGEKYCCGKPKNIREYPFLKFTLLVHPYNLFCVSPDKVALNL